MKEIEIPDYPRHLGKKKNKTNDVKNSNEIELGKRKKQ